MKKCTVCKKEKELIEFAFIKSRMKERSRCKQCDREYSKKHYEKNKNTYNERRKKYYLENKEKELNRCKEYYDQHREDIRNKIKKKYASPIWREKARLTHKKWRDNNPGRHSKTGMKHKIMNPEKHKARIYVLWAVKLGMIIRPDNCMKCFRKIKVEGHHTDYSKPLDVIWLCKTCHCQEHGKMLDVNPGEDYGSNTSRFHISSNSEES